MIKTWFDGNLFLIFLSLFFGCTSNRSDESRWVSVQCSWHSICIQKFFSFLHYVVKCWEAAAICFYECYTMGVNNNVDYYCESLQLQLIWLAAVGTFSSHNGSRINSKNIILNEHFVFGFWFSEKAIKISKRKIPLWFTRENHRRNLVQALDTLQWPKYQFSFFFFYVSTKFNLTFDLLFTPILRSSRVLTENPVYEYVRRICRICQSAPVSSEDKNQK